MSQRRLQVDLIYRLIAAGVLATLTSVLLVSLVTRPPPAEKIRGLVIWETDLWKQERRWLPTRWRGLGSRLKQPFPTC